MSEALLGTLLVAALFLLFAMGVEIALALGMVGIAGLLYLKGWTIGLGVVGSIAWIVYSRSRSPPISNRPCSSVRTEVQNSSVLPATTFSS